MRWPVLFATVILCALFMAAFFYSCYNGGNIGPRYLWTSRQISPNLSSRNNLAYGKKTALSTGEAAYSSLGVDGDRTGLYGVNTKDHKPISWQVDLGDVEEISEIVIYKIKNGYSDMSIPFEILLSPDGDTISYKKTISKKEQANYWRVIVPEVKTRFIVFRTLGSGLLAFAEVEVYK